MANDLIRGDLHETPDRGLESLWVGGRMEVLGGWYPRESWKLHAPLPHLAPQVPSIELVLSYMHYNKQVNISQCFPEF